MLMKSILYLYKKYLKYEGKGCLFLAILEIVFNTVYEVGNAVLLSSTVLILMSSYSAIIKILFIVSYICILHLCSIACVILGNEFDKKSNRFKLKFGKELQERLISMDYETFESHKVQNYIQEAQKVSFYGNTIGLVPIISKVPKVIGAAINLVCFFIIISLKINQTIAIVLLVTEILSVFFYMKIGEKDHEYEKQIEPIYSQYMYLCRAVLNNKELRDINFYRLNTLFLEQFTDIRNRYMKISKSSVMWHFVSNYLEKVVSIIRDMVIYSFIIVNVVQGELSIDVFVLYIGISENIFAITKDMFVGIQMIMKNSAIISRYVDFMEEEKTRKFEVFRKNEKIDIEFKNVWFKYPNQEDFALKDLNVKILSGTKIAIVGNNGAGKSTFVKLLCGLYHPTSGKIMINGKDIEGYRPEELYRIYSVLFQDSDVLAYSIKENIGGDISQNIDKHKLKESIKLSNTQKIIEQYAIKENQILTKELDDAGVELSGGEKQKVLLARTIYKDAPIIILDEPVASLDAVSEEKLYQQYKTIINENTAIFVTHRLNSALFCEYILVLKDGQIIEKGSHQELLQLRGEYYKNFEIQSKYYHS